jgi:amidase/aspartyl-tRNA(Asn)/glutamyl-tRNA(Gln) amidotransferase subunit A
MTDRISHLTAADVESLAETLDLDVAAARTRTIAEQINDGLHWYDDLDAYGHAGTGPATTPSAVLYDPPVDDDPLNAFITRFDLPPSDGGGPLDGLDVAVKDNVAVAGVPMTCGSRALEGVVPQRHASVVDRLLGAGATLVGKTNMDELAYGPTGETSQFGPARNPVDTDHVTGGSSSGSGAAVGAGTVDAALGSDTGGSVRIPAAFCGVVGVKPSWGVVPRFGFVELAYSLDHVGPLARDVETAARVLDAIAGFDERDPSSAMAERVPGSFADAVADPPEIGSLSVGLPTGFYGETVEPGVRAVIDDCLDTIEAAGASTTEVSLPTVEDTVAASNVITVSEFFASVRGDGVPFGRNVEYDTAWQDGLAAALDARGHELGPIATRKLIEGAHLTERYRGRHYVRARNACRRLGREFAAAFEDVDVLITPTLPTVAPALGEWSPDTYGESVPIAINTRPVNLAGLPAVTVPAGTHDGLPVGLQCIGPAYEDPATLAIARAVERDVVDG